MILGAAVGGDWTFARKFIEITRKAVKLKNLENIFKTKLKITNFLT